MEEEKPKTKKKQPGKTGRPPGPVIGLTDDDYSKVEKMSGLGLNMVQIGAIIGMSKATIERRRNQDPRLREVMDRGRSMAIAKVSQVAFSMASSGKNPDMTKFYLRTQAGWSEKLHIEGDVKHEIVFASKIGDDGVLKLDANPDEEGEIIDVDAIDT